MAFLSRKVDYALLIMAVLHRRGSGACAREIADAYGLGRPFVANILKRLCSKGLVQSHRGVRGGYVLGRPASRITMAQLLDALEDPFHLTECSTASEHTCNLEGVCPVKGPITRVHKRIGEILGQTTLESLFDESPCEGSIQEGTIQLGWNGAVLATNKPHAEPDLVASMAGAASNG
jgi:Rrf2 family protein